MPYRAAFWTRAGLKQRDKPDADHHQGATENPPDAGRMLGKPEPAKMIEYYRQHRRGRDEQTDVHGRPKPRHDNGLRQQSHCTAKPSEPCPPRALYHIPPGREPKLIERNAD